MSVTLHRRRAESSSRSLPSGRRPTPPASYPDRIGARRRRWIGDLMGTLGIAGLVAVTALWLHDGGVQALDRPGGVATGLGRLSGLVASYLLLLQVILMARIPWIEGIWGQDALVRRHRLIGFLSFHLMLVHIVAITLGYAAAADTGTWGQLVTLVLDDPGMLLAAAGTVALIAVVATSIRAARRSLRYESWHLIHLYAYLGVALALPHQLWTGADFTASPLATVFWWTVWGAAVGAILLWRIASPVYRTLRHRLVVEQVIRESPSVVSLVIRGRSLDTWGLRAGQYCQWRFLGAPGWTRAHPVTLSAAPSAEHLRITVREMGDGTRDTARIRPGSRVLVEGAYGRMTAHRRRRRDVLMIAAGVGMTTMRGLAEEIVQEAPSQGPNGLRGPSVVVIHRIPTPSDALFPREFAALARRGDLRVVAAVGHRHPEVSGWWGGPVPLDPATAIRSLVPDLTDREVYLCGPGPWMQEVRTTLRSMGADTRHIHAEEFGW